MNVVHNKQGHKSCYVEFLESLNWVHLKKKKIYSVCDIPGLDVVAESFRRTKERFGVYLKLFYYSIKNTLSIHGATFCHLLWLHAASPFH